MKSHEIWTYKNVLLFCAKMLKNARKHQPHRRNLTPSDSCFFITLCVQVAVIIVVFRFSPYCNVSLYNDVFFAHNTTKNFSGFAIFSFMNFSLDFCLQCIYFPLIVERYLLEHQSRNLPPFSEWFCSSINTKYWLLLFTIDCKVMIAVTICSVFVRSRNLVF